MSRTTAIAAINAMAEVERLRRELERVNLALTDIVRNNSEILGLLHAAEQKVRELVAERDALQSKIDEEF